MSSDQSSGEADRSFEHEPVRCSDCEHLVVVTRNENADTADQDPRFECACSVGSMGAVKPDSWNGGQFL